MITTDAIYRKVGDDIDISGIFIGNKLPAAPWTGATAVLSVRRVVDGVLVINRQSCPIDVSALTYAYTGVALNVPGKYDYEIEVTFLNTKKLTFPNNGNARLIVVDQIA
jgi:hypothetical protein